MNLTPMIQVLKSFRITVLMLVNVINQIELK